MLLAYEISPITKAHQRIINDLKIDLDRDCSFKPLGTMGSPVSIMCGRVSVMRELRETVYTAPVVWYYSKFYGYICVLQAWPRASEGKREMCNEME